jgi:ligand-binding SRPBCC domain-containing protein
MAVHSFHSVQRIPVSLSEAWDFFSHPKNLAIMTPGYLNLQFTNELLKEEMYPGQIITYHVKPLMGIPLFWMTEITQLKPKEFFVDEQRFGPYSFWHHQHHFRTIDGGVEMTDQIHYKNPGWILGKIANYLFIKKKLEGIFSYRFKMVEEIFGRWEGEKEPERVEIHL